MSSTETIDALGRTRKAKLSYSPVKDVVALLHSSDESLKSPIYAHFATSVDAPPSLAHSAANSPTPPSREGEELKHEELKHEITFGEEEQDGTPILLAQDIENLEKSLEDSFEDQKSASAVQKQFEFREKLEQIAERNSKQLEAQLENRRAQREAKAAKTSAREKAMQWNIEKENISLRQHYAQLGLEAELKLQKCEQEKLEQQQRRQRKAIEKCGHLQQETLRLQQAFTSICQQSRYPQLLPEDLQATVEEALVELRNTQLSLGCEMESNNPDSGRIEELQSTIESLLAEASYLQGVVEESNMRGDSEVRRQQQEQEAARRVEEQARQVAQEQARQQEEEEKVRQLEKAKHEQEQQLAAAAQQKGATSTPQMATPAGSGLSSTVGMPKSALSEYKVLQSHLLEATKSLQLFSSDASLKKYRFDLQKAVTLNVNAISAQSGQQVLEKLSYLKRLLKKQPVEVSGRKVSANNHSLAYLFCCNLLAKKFVEQGQVAPKHDIFPYASVVVAMWTEFPDFGALFLAHLYQACPVLVPYYVPMETGMSEIDHMILQGYKVSDDGKAESEDDFLKRMGGVVRLYAAIIQTQHSIFGAGVPHPHGLECGWMWLARVLNADPRPSITATALCEFLEVCGYALQREYKKQFRKLFIVMCKDYIPKIEGITSQRGPLERLKLFLEGCSHTGKIPEPEGLLKLDFWKTKSRDGGIVSA